MSRDASEPAERRRGRLGLFLPFILLLLALGGWSVWWFVIANRVEDAVGRSASDLRQAGYEVQWSRLAVEGWPFRTHIRFRDLVIRAPSGHALLAQRLDAQANTYALDHWVAVAPNGVTVVRGDKGAVRINGQALRASLSGLGATPPRLVIELREPVFTPAPGAEPFPLTSATHVALNVRPSGAGVAAGEFLFRIEHGVPRPDGMLDWIGGGQPFDTHWEGVITRLDFFRGAGWGQAVRRWSQSGGSLSAVRGKAFAGSASAEADAPRMTVGPEGRLRGRVDLTATGGPESLLAMGRARAVDPAGAGAAAAATAAAGGLDGTARMSLEFTDEGAKLGPVRLAGSPQIY